MSQKNQNFSQQEQLALAALDYHRFPKPGKLSIRPTKPMANAQDLSLAYSPGVAEPCRAIAQDPAVASHYTSRGNLVAVISNGTAVLGLGDIGALASKPVMEGKAVLFKKFAGIDVFDIEINEKDPKKLIEIIKSLEPTFGGINLEDIKAPECFEIEQALTQSMSIPVFHDDQHGTAIIVAAAILNGLKIVEKEITQVKLAVCGAGAAALACLDLLQSFGFPKKNIFVADQKGAIHKGRDDLNTFKEAYAQEIAARTLADIVKDADIFLGLSSGNGILTEEMVCTMAPRPIILALANPHPEILPETVARVRPDGIIATGRSDFPNQVNNVLCFPYIFRGALDVGATHINLEMKKACVHALARLAQMESAVSEASYGGTHHKFGPQYIIPKTFDPRLLLELAPAVAQAAMDTGVATRPIKDFDAYRQELINFVYRSGWLMRPIFAQAQEKPKSIVYSGGEESRTLQAAQMAVDEGLMRPILIGRRSVVLQQIERLGLRIQEGQDYTIMDVLTALDSNRYWETYHALMNRNGVTPALAKTSVLTNPTILGSLMVHMGEADALLCGTSEHPQTHIKTLRDVIGMAHGIQTMATLTVMLLPRGVFFLTDTSINVDPTAQQISEITRLAAQHVKKFGIEPKIALLSHSNFGSASSASSLKMSEALKLIREADPHLEVEGEMNADLALDEHMRHRIFPHSRLKGQANLLVMPNVDSASITSHILGFLEEGLAIGPLVLGLAKPAHILTSSMTARDILKISALAVVEAQSVASITTKA